MTIFFLISTQNQFIISLNKLLVNYNQILSFLLRKTYKYENFKRTILFLVLSLKQLCQHLIFDKILIMKRLQIISSHIAEQGTSQTYTKIIVQKAEGAVTLWMNSPKDLNSLSITMTKQLQTSLKEANEDNSIKIIIIRSKLQKVFCAGGDIKIFKQNDFSSYPHCQHFKRVEESIKAVRKPIISVVEGRALGGGFQLALFSDIIIGSEKAQFGLPQLNLGIMPGMGGTQILPRLVGSKVAMKMILTGQIINAAEAQRLNIAHIFPAEQFQAKLKSFIQTLTNKASDSLYAAKKAIKLAYETTLDQGLDYQNQLLSFLFTKKGSKEGVSAFIEKRKPNFKNI